jgi:hypothetical protein
VSNDLKPISCSCRRSSDSSCQSWRRGDCVVAVTLVAMFAAGQPVRVGLARASFNGLSVCRTSIGQSADGRLPEKSSHAANLSEQLVRRIRVAGARIDERAEQELPEACSTTKQPPLVMVCLKQDVRPAESASA